MFNKLSEGRKKINGVISKVNKMVDDLEVGQIALTEHKTQNEDVIRTLQDENKSIDSEYQIAENYKNFFKQAGHSSKLG